jgi:hypothetical protein
MDRLQFGLDQLDRLANYFPRIESKASAIFAIDVAILSVITINYSPEAIWSAPAALGCLASILLGLSIWQLYRAFFPDIKSGTTYSAVYFGDIARDTLAEYEGRYSNLTVDSLTSDVVCQIHRNSQILLQKYKHVKAAIALTGAGTIAGIAFLSTSATSGTPLQWGF